MTSDRWAEWLLERRFAGDDAFRDQMLEELRQVRDRVLDRAELARGDVVLDVGCGDGLIGFGALERGAGTVIFSDVSNDLLARCRAIAHDLDVVDRSRFVLAPAERIEGVPDGTVDVVTTRSVLIYVADKERAFREFFRVLRPGGRLSIFEPINRLSNFLDAYDVAPVEDLFSRVQAVFQRLQPADSDPMLNFDERDLVGLAEAAGFKEVTLDLELESRPPEPQRWETFVGSAGNPNIPTFGEAMEDVLTPEERERLVNHLRPLVKAGRGRLRTAVAYLRATVAT